MTKCPKCGRMYVAASDAAYDAHRKVCAVLTGETKTKAPSTAVEVDGVVIAMTRKLNLDDTPMEPEPEQEAVGVGSIFYRSWGYDQTNVNYYKVIKISPSGKTVWLREIRSAVLGTEGVVADDEFYGDEVYQKRVQRLSYNDEIALSWNSYSNAYLWDGQPKYDTTALGYAGH